jgi:hypothetical protein
MPDGASIAMSAARSIGVTAAAALAAGPTSAEVAAVFARALYLRLDTGWLCIGPPGLGDGPLNVLCALPDGLDWRQQGLQPNVAIDDRCIRLAPNHLLAWRDAPVWQPPTPGAWRRESLRRGLDALVRGATSPVEGLGLFLHDEPQPDTRESRKAAPAVASLCHWLADDGHAAVQGLIGLGPGLTPSGDDFLGGAMIALRATGDGDRADALWRMIEPTLATRTVAVSAAHLCAAAAGHGSAALHDALNALLADDSDKLADAVVRLDRIGHCSGWDALAGVATALRAIVEED